ncbi:MAG TPA: tape measure protein [Rhizobium sp.]
MADNSDDLLISVSTDVTTLRRSNKKLEAAMAESLKKIESLTTTSGAKMDAAFARSGNSMAASIRKVEVASRQAGSAGASMSAAYAKIFALAGTAKGFQELVDSSTRMTNSLKVAGLQGASLKGVMDQLYASALKNHAPVESLTTLYGRAALQQKELGASSQQLVTFTDNVGKALRVSGTTAAEAEGSLLQLGQALGSGTVHAEEFNSILEGMPAFAQAAAKGIKQANGSVAELKNLVINGKISSRALFDGFIAGAADLDAKLQDTGTTIGQAFTDLQTSLTKAAGKFNEASGAGKAAVDVIEGAVSKLNQINFNGLADNIQGVIGKLNEMGRAYDDLLGKASSGPSLKDRIDAFVAPVTGGKPLVNLGPAFSNQTIDVNKLAQQRAANQTQGDSDKLKALQEQLDAANALQKAMGLPVNNEANLEIIRQMDAIRDRIAKAKDELISFKAAAGRPDVLQGVGRVPSFKDQPSPKTITPIDANSPQYAANAANLQKIQDAYKDLTKSAKDRNEQLQQEISLVGKSGAVLDAARTKLQMMQKAIDAGITGDQLKNIQAMADAYGKLSQQLAGATIVQSATEQNQGMQQELALVGKTGVAYDVAKYKLDLLNEAKKNGVDGEALKGLNAQIDAYAKLADTLSKVKLYQELNDNNRLSALPDRDRQIVTMQRQYGQPEDPNSATGQAIGASIDAQANREAVTSFLGEFKDGLIKNGDSIGEAFGNAMQKSICGPERSLEFMEL